MHRERVSENVYWFQSEIYAQVTAGVVAGPQWAIVIDTLALPEETLAEDIPARRLGRPEELGAVAAFLASEGPVDSYTTSRTEFIGRNGTPASPAAMRRVGLGGETGRFLDNCGALMRVVELMARFDEEANINWADRLEREGAQVVYGVFGLKTHAKLALILRREPAGGGHRLVPYAHLGTGNYHPRTARQYTDFGLLTADADLCHDVNEVFLHITSLAKAARMRKLLLAPFTMHRRVLEMIRRETRHAREGKPARIIASNRSSIFRYRTSRFIVTTA